MQEDKTEIILAQWQTCVEMANEISQRRDVMNSLFSTLNLAIVAAITFAWDIKTVTLIIAGLAICVVWFVFIRNYRELNKEKFKVINEIEKMLPIKAFKDEWNAIQQNKKYKESTKLEVLLPTVFIVLYAVILIILIAVKCCGNGGN